MRKIARLKFCFRSARASFVFISISPSPKNDRNAAIVLSMKLLITGICGFVGSSLAKYLRTVSPDWEIHGVDNFIRPGSELNRLELKRLGVKVRHADLRSASDFETMPAVDAVIDAAANASVLAGMDGQSSSRQLVEHNLSGTINLLEYCKAHRAAFPSPEHQPRLFDPTPRRAADESRR